MRRFSTTSQTLETYLFGEKDFFQAIVANNRTCRLIILHIFEQENKTMNWAGNWYENQFCDL